MEGVQRLISQYFKSSRKELMIGGIGVSELAEQYGTPMFVYDRNILLQKYQSLRNALPAEFEIYYSVKANPHPRVLQFFLSQGLGLEVASAGELHMALQAGCPPEKIIFAGPGKTMAELSLAIQKNIREIHLESFTERERISFLSRQSGKKTRISIRINPGKEAQGGAMQMGGKPSPFGIDEEKLDEMLNLVLQDSYLDLQGIHLFIGTQILDHRILLSQYRKGFEIAERVAQRIPGPLRIIDFGGGYGVPYFKNETALDLTELKRELELLVAEKKRSQLFQHTQFLIEPGRFLTAEAGVYVARINDIKVSKGKKFLIMDGGMHHHLAASGNLGQIIKRNYPLAILNKLQEPYSETVEVVGPLCTPLDTLGRSVQLPEAHIGDLIGIFQSGAYALSASPLGFLSHQTPAEVWVEDGQHSRLKSRLEYQY